MVLTNLPLYGFTNTTVLKPSTLSDWIKPCVLGTHIWADINQACSIWNITLIAYMSLELRIYKVWKDR